MWTLLAILGWIIFGFIVGGLARFLMPGRQPMTFFQTAMLGVGGSLAGGALGYVITGGDLYQPAGWIMSIVGALLVLWIGISVSQRTGRTI